MAAWTCHGAWNIEKSSRNGIIKRGIHCMEVEYTRGISLSTFSFSHRLLVILVLSTLRPSQTPQRLIANVRTRVACESYLRRSTGSDGENSREQDGPGGTSEGRGWKKEWGGGRGLRWSEISVQFEFRHLQTACLGTLGSTGHRWFNYWLNWPPGCQGRRENKACFYFYSCYKLELDEWLGCMDGIRRNELKWMDGSLYKCQVYGLGMNGWLG